MNIFILDEDPVNAALLQCDKHVVKMPLESAQMLSTAHRVLDGDMYLGPSKSGKRTVKKWEHREYDDVLYNVVHLKHPCTVWTMQSVSNYNWHYQHFIALCDEYTHRYGRRHLSDEKLREILATPPANTPLGGLTQKPLAMKANPECINVNDPIGSYRAYYRTKKERFGMVWTKRNIPEWFLL
jgi:hypothetical protein